MGPAEAEDLVKKKKKSEESVLPNSHNSRQ